MKKISFILITFILVLSISPQILAMDSFTEDSWFGTYFIMGENVNVDIFKVFYDIRQSNYLNRNPDSDIKTILADYILMSNFSIFGKNPDLMEMDREQLLEKVNNNSFVNSNNIEVELNLLYKIKNEIKTRYIALNNNFGPNQFYRFYHIQVSKFEEATTEDLNSDIIKKNNTYNRSFATRNNEFPGSIQTTNRINDMLPIRAESIKQYTDSPLVTYYQSSYSENTKDKLRNKLDNVIFKTYEVVSIQERSFTLKDMQQIYNFFNKYDQSIFEYIFNNTEIKRLDQSISELLKELE